MNLPSPYTLLTAALTFFLSTRESISSVSGSVFSTTCAKTFASLLTVMRPYLVRSSFNALLDLEELFLSLVEISFNLFLFKFCKNGETLFANLEFLLAFFSASVIALSLVADIIPNIFLISTTAFFVLLFVEFTAFTSLLISTTAFFVLLFVEFTAFTSLLISIVAFFAFSVAFITAAGVFVFSAFFCASSDSFCASLTRLSADAIRVWLTFARRVLISGLVSAASTAFLTSWLVGLEKFPSVVRNCLSIDTCVADVACCSRWPRWSCMLSALWRRKRFRAVFGRGAGC